MTIHSLVPLRICNEKKGTFGIFTGFGHLQTSETSGRNMTVELDSRHPLLPKAGWENEDLTLILRKKNAHAKGAQYAAGGYIKREADLSVIRGRTSIQNGKDLFDFCNKNLQQPKSTRCKRRIFRCRVCSAE